MNKLSQFIQYAIIRTFGAFINILPFPVALSMARPIGIFLSYVLKRQRRKTLENLSSAFGASKTPAEIKRLVRETFVHLAEFAVEWFRLPAIARAPRRYLQINGVEKIHRSLKNGNGAILLATHNGNWEIMSLIGGHLIAEPVGASIYALARPLKNSFLYNYTLRLRGLTGLKSINKSGGVRAMFRCLRKNNIVCLLVDQRIREGSIEVDFFGRKALTSSLPALAARQCNTPVFHVFLKRTKEQHYIMDVEGPVTLAVSEDRHADIAANTQKFNDRIEEEIRKDPTQWLWMHNRWRV